MNSYKDFTTRLKLLIRKHPVLMVTTLSNIFTMRLIGNKTHGDLSEIAIVEFINQYMYDFSSTHVGKDLFRAKKHEEDIAIKNEITKNKFSVSLKAYGDGPLQLSTDKNSLMFTRLKKEGKSIEKSEKIKALLNDPAFSEFNNLNILPLIYNEKQKECNILIFDHKKAMRNISRICLEESGKGRKHPVYKFFDRKNQYVCEVRYGGATANALQRGLWTHTKKGISYFDSITDGWIEYSHNLILVQLFSHALVSSQAGHTSGLKKIKEDILRLKQRSGLER